MKTKEKPRVHVSRREVHSGNGKYSIAVLDKAFEILQVLQESEQPLLLDEIVERTGIARTTAHRLLQNLARRGYLEKNPENYRYHLGVKLVELGNAVRRRQTLRDVAIPVLEEVRNKLGETVNLATLHEGEVSYLEILESPHSFRIAANPGVRDPAHATALGKCLLAHLEESEVKRIVKAHGMKRLTRKTIGNESELMTELSRIRALGYALDDEESVEGGRCVGAPIFGAEGKVVAAVSVSGPNLRIARQRIPAIARELKKACSEISRRLGHTR